MGKINKIIFTNERYSLKVFTGLYGACRSTVCNNNLRCLFSVCVYIIVEEFLPTLLLIVLFYFSYLDLQAFVHEWFF